MNRAQRLRHVLGDRVRELRHQRPGLTQERLANGAGLHPVFLSRLERGTTGVTVDTVAALCSVIGLTLAEFFEPFTQSLKGRGLQQRRQNLP